MSSDLFGFNTTQQRALLRLFAENVMNSVDTAAIENLAVTTAKLAADAVVGSKIADDAVDTEHLAAGAVTNAEIDAAAAIALTKLADVAAGSDGLAAASITANLQTLFTAVAELDAWATALATKLNADAGVTDVNYDTDPHA